MERANNNCIEWLGSILNSIENINIAGSGIKLADKTRHITHQDLATVIHKLQLDKKLVIVVDAYPDVIEAIYKNEGLDAVNNCHEKHPQRMPRHIAQSNGAVHFYRLYWFRFISQ